MSESAFADLRATLAAVPLLEPPPDLLRRWHAALAQLPPPARATEPTTAPARHDVPAAELEAAPAEQNAAVAEQGTVAAEHGVLGAGQGIADAGHDVAGAEQEGTPAQATSAAPGSPSPTADHRGGIGRGEAADPTIAPAPPTIPAIQPPRGTNAQATTDSPITASTRNRSGAEAPSGTTAPTTSGEHPSATAARPASTAARVPRCSTTPAGTDTPTAVAGQGHPAKNPTRARTTGNFPTASAPDQPPPTADRPITPAAARPTTPTNHRPRPRRDQARRHAAIGAAVLAAAAAAVLVALPGTATPTGPPRPVPGLQAPRPPLDDPGQRAGCLARIGAPGATVVGIRTVQRGGQAALLLVLATATPGQFHTVVVTVDCGPDAGAVLEDRVTGR